MIDDDHDMSSDLQVPSPVAAPLPSELVYDGSSAFIVAIWDEHPKPIEVASYLARWPPSRTPDTFAAWIAVERGPQSNPQKIQDLAGLSREWEILKQRAADLAVVQQGIEGQDALQCFTANPMVTVEALDALALAYGVLSGKWLIYAESHKIDELWSRIVTAVIANAPPGVGARAKVSPARPGELHVVCVYVEDYSDEAEVGRVRESLRRVGVRWKIGFKPDIYTHLGIYKANEWKIRPSRYFS
ncbi:hypothetical protein C0993_005537 [Termitomyces sp. T159_Od127]|nr:hypothetical protein C0993_005537 [Termitomyces sp. T159_Od127]